MKKTVLALAVVAAALCACTKPENPTGVGRKPVKFTVGNLGTVTLKSATIAIGEDGCSKVGIYAADLGADNVQATVTGNALTPDNTIYWKVGQTESTQFVARYPHANDGGINDAYTVAADQSSEDAFSYHANVMTAVQTASPDPGTVAFNFTHPFAKVVVNVTNNLGEDAVSSVVLQNVKQTASTLNMTTSPATTTLDGEEDPVNVTAYGVSATQFAMIILPQALTASMNIVVTTSKGSVYTFQITNADYVFHAGNVATANVTIDPIGGSNFNRTAVGAMTFETTPWGEEATTIIGTVGDPTLGASYMQIGGTLYIDDDADAVDAGTLHAWEKWYNMVYSATNTWTAIINYDESMEDNDANKGFLIRTAANNHVYYKMWNGSPNIGTEPYQLYEADGDHTKNIRLTAATGKYLVTFNSSTGNISVEAQ